MTEMEGAVLRDEKRRAEIWLTAMLPHLKKSISFEQFVGGKTRMQSDIGAWAQAWDKVDAALARRH